jgi:hypothetical protein
MPKAPHQHDNSFRKNRAAFKAKHRALRTPCARCHGSLGPIDYDCQPQTSKAFELGHTLPKATHPHLFYDEGNWQPEHCSCNRSAQMKSNAETEEPQQTGAWVKAAW